MDIIKLGTALPKTVGKTIERVFLVPLPADQFQLYLVFTDGTYYEVYGKGQLSGGRCVDTGELKQVRAICARNSASSIEVARWGAGAPHVLRAYMDGRRALIAANRESGGLSIMGLFPDCPHDSWKDLSRFISASPSPIRLLSDVACELLLANGNAFGSPRRLVLEGFLGSGGLAISPTTVIPVIPMWARSAPERADALLVFARTVVDWRDAGFNLEPELGDRLDDPEDLLRPFLPSGEVPASDWIEEFVSAARRILNGTELPSRRPRRALFRGAVTGRELNRRHNLGAAHALYHKDGTWYQRLTRFPGILCDPNGFVRYETEAAFLADPRLSIGEQVNVRGTIAEHPEYLKFEDAHQHPLAKRLRVGTRVRRRNGSIGRIESISGPGLHGAIVVVDGDLIEVVPDGEFGWQEYERDPRRR